MPSADSTERLGMVPREYTVGSNPSAGASRVVILWRLRAAGGLLAISGVVSLVALILPWTYAYWPPDRHCPSCAPETQTPADAIARVFSGPHLPATVSVLGVADIVGLPLVFVVLGVGLLLRHQPMRVRWKVFVILAASLAYCSAYFLAAGMGLHYFGSTAVVRSEIGETAGMWAPLVAFTAGVVVPATRRARGSASDASRT